MISRRSFLTGAAAAIGTAAAAEGLLTLADRGRKIFLPPVGGWPHGDWFYTMNMSYRAFEGAGENPWVRYGSNNDGSPMTRHKWLTRRGVLSRQSLEDILWTRETADFAAEAMTTGFAGMRLVRTGAGDLEWHRIHAEQFRKAIEPGMRAIHGAAYDDHHAAEWAEVFK